MTAIAWRLAHLIVGVLGVRNGTHFGARKTSSWTGEWPTTAAGALAELDNEADVWRAGVLALSDDRLWEPVGEAELSGREAGGPQREDPACQTLRA